MQRHQIISARLAKASRPPVAVTATEHIGVFLKGSPPHAERTFLATPRPITTFPFRIGPERDDPLADPDWMLPDVVPSQLSPHHVALVHIEGYRGVAGRQRHLEALVDGKRLGGPQGSPAPLFLPRIVAYSSWEKTTHRFAST